MENQDQQVLLDLEETQEKTEHQAPLAFPGHQAMTENEAHLVQLDPEDSK